MQSLNPLTPPYEYDSQAPTHPSLQASRLLLLHVDLLRRSSVTRVVVVIVLARALLRRCFGGGRRVRSGGFGGRSRGGGGGGDCGHRAGSGALAARPRVYGEEEWGDILFVFVSRPLLIPIPRAPTTSASALSTAPSTAPTTAALA